MTNKTPKLEPRTQQQPRRTRLPGGHAGVSILALALAASIDTSASAQVLSGDLTYSAVEPCRIIDTRLQLGGRIAANTARSFHVVGSTASFPAQGGKAGGCGIPAFSGGEPQALAVMINLIAVAPLGPGNLRAWPTDNGVPLASVINYTNVDLANGFVLPLRQDNQGFDIRIQADVSGTHVVADVLGFFAPTRPRRYYLTKTSAFNGAEAPSACAAGFHMASLFEILDTTALLYDTARGYATDDSGDGPPGLSGWVRTGYLFGNDNQPGRGNCGAYASAVPTEYGSLARPDDDWKAAATVVSPWETSVSICATDHRVWCVEDR
jgi:hypothetical protein